MATTIHRVFNMTKTLAVALLLLQPQLASADWFDDVKSAGNKEDLYRVLYYMPKGGDLHNHLSGAAYSEWWYELALAEKSRGYQYYTKVRIENCRGYGGDEFHGRPYLLLFHNIMAVEYDALDDCEKAEYKPLENLDENEIALIWRSQKTSRKWRNLYGRPGGRGRTCAEPRCSDAWPCAWRPCRYVWRPGGGPPRPSPCRRLRWRRGQL